MFTACDQQLCFEFSCTLALRIQTCAAVYQAEGRDKDVFVPSSAHQEISGNIQTLTRNGSKLQDNLEVAKISLSKIIPVEIAPRQTYPPLCIDFRVIFKLIRKGIQRRFCLLALCQKVPN